MEDVSMESSAAQQASAAAAPTSSDPAVSNDASTAGDQPQQSAPDAVSAAVISEPTGNADDSSARQSAAAVKDEPAALPQHSGPSAESLKIHIPATTMRVAFSEEYIQAILNNNARLIQEWSDIATGAATATPAQVLQIRTQLTNSLEFLATIGDRRGGQASTFPRQRLREMIPAELLSVEDVVIPPGSMMPAMSPMGAPQSQPVPMPSYQPQPQMPLMSPPVRLASFQSPDPSQSGGRMLPPLNTSAMGQSMAAGGPMTPGSMGAGGMGPGMGGPGSMGPGSMGPAGMGGMGPAMGGPGGMSMAGASGAMTPTGMQGGMTPGQMPGSMMGMHPSMRQVGQHPGSYGGMQSPMAAGPYMMSQESPAAAAMHSQMPQYMHQSQSAPHASSMPAYGMQQQSQPSGLFSPMSSGMPSAGSYPSMASAGGSGPTGYPMHTQQQSLSMSTTGGYPGGPQSGPAAMGYGGPSNAAAYQSMYNHMQQGMPGPYDADRPQ